MKKQLFCLTCVATLLSATGVHAEESAKPAAKVADDTTMIVDLRTNPADLFTYGSWGGKIVAAKSGLAF